jgi:PAS domain-containing protein
METTPHTPFRPVRSSPRELSTTIRRWTREVAHLRTRAFRLRPPSDVDAPVNAALEEALTLCTELLQDLAGADMEIQRRTEEARAERHYGEYLFDRMGTPCLGTDDHGRITRANRAAALLLNVSVRHLVGQPLLHYTLDRDGFMELLRRTRGERAQFQGELMIRPRERSVIHAAITLMPRSPEDTTEWLWLFAPDRVVPAPAATRRTVAIPLHVPSDGHDVSVAS